MNIYAIYSKSLNHISRYFFSKSDKEAIEFVLNNLYDCRDIGLVQGTLSGDLQLIAVGSVPSADELDFEKVLFQKELGEIPGAQDFIKRTIIDSQTFRKVD